ncbi:hypothetical protein V7094_29030 [Priestia megaterium]|uniref:hypothetical protein n=1 Tax=Priestia megaterium TaxID=1404 RepID=UPI00300082E2
MSRESRVFLEAKSNDMVHAVPIVHGSRFEVDKMYFFDAFIANAYKNVSKVLEKFELVIEEMTLSGVIIRFDEKKGVNHD